LGFVLATIFGEKVGLLPQPAAIFRFGAMSRALSGRSDQFCTDQVVERCVGVRRNALQKISPPSLPMINPGVDSVAIAAKFGDRELGEPPIVHNCLHWSLAPGRGVLVTKQHNRSYGVVAVREYIRFNTNQV